MFARLRQRYLGALVQDFLNDFLLHEQAHLAAVQVHGRRHLLVVHNVGVLAKGLHQGVLDDLGDHLARQAALGANLIQRQDKLALHRCDLIPAWKEESGLWTHFLIRAVRTTDA